MKPRYSISVALLIFLVTAAFVQAEPYSITPWIKARQSYSDNILFSETHEVSDFKTTITGGLTLEQNLERLKSSLSGQLNQFLYWDYSELNALDYNVSGNLKYRVTERTGVNASARYAKDSQRDRDTETTGLLVTGDRKSADVSLGADYMISELAKVNISVDLGDSQTQKMDSDEDNNTLQVNLAFHRDLAKYFKNTVGLFKFMYLHYTGEEDSSTESGLWNYTILQEYASDVYQFSTGFSHNFSELLSMYCQTGASYTQTSEKQDIDRSYNDIPLSRISGTEYNTDTWGGILSTGVDYKNEYWTMGLALSQDVRGATGTSGVVQRTSLSGRLDRKVSDELSLTFRASAYLNKNERETSSDTDTLTCNLQPGIMYRFRNDLILSGGWRFTSVEDREDDTNKTRHLVYFDLKKEFDLKDF